MPVLSLSNTAGAIWIVLALVLVCNKKTRYCGFAILLAMGLDTLLAEGIIKHLVCRVRPCNLVDDVAMLVHKPTSYSFPSNHSASSFAAVTAIFLTARNKLWTIPAFVLAFLIAFSRLYVFVHFPSDVLTGMVLGIVVAIIVCYIMKKSGFKDILKRNNIVE
jgi:undecaprenyl-diphosphatase